MFDREHFAEILEEYKSIFANEQWNKEKYKWVALKHFQDHWDINANDFPSMLEESLKKADNLLTSAGRFPARMIVVFAQLDAEEVRSMYMNLFDESKELFARIDEFKKRATVLLDRWQATVGKSGRMHYQDENTITTYLWLRYPEKHYIYKYGEVRNASSELRSNYRIKKGAYANNIRNTVLFYDEIGTELSKDTQMKSIIQSCLDDTCYQGEQIKTLTCDFGFYVSRYVSQTNDNTTEETTVDETNMIEKSDDVVIDELINEAGHQYWWLIANPRIWSFSDLEKGETQAYSLYTNTGSKRRIFRNFLDAREGDLVIGYESSPNRKVVALARVVKEQDGTEIVFQKVEEFENPISWNELHDCDELKNAEPFVNPQGSLFKLTKEEFDFICDQIYQSNPVLEDKSVESYTKVDFLNQVYMSEERYERLVHLLKNKKNIILQGAPGVGKTFTAKRLAYSMMGCKDEDRVEFIQFHQNYSYEDFVMGYKPSEEGFELRNGIFYRFCKKASNHPDKEFFFIIDEINRGNLSKIFGELLMLIERDYRGTKATLAYTGENFAVPKNVYIIGMMNTADRSLALIDYALRRRFSFFDIEPGFDTAGFVRYQEGLNNETFDELILRIKDLNQKIANDRSLGKGFCIGHSYFCECTYCTDEWMQSVIDYDILPMLNEYWFDDANEVQRWDNILHGVFQ